MADKLNSDYWLVLARSKRWFSSPFLVPTKGHPDTLNRNFMGGTYIALKSIPITRAAFEALNKLSDDELSEEF